MKQYTVRTCDLCNKIIKKEQEYRDIFDKSTSFYLTANIEIPATFREEKSLWWHLKNMWDYEKGIECSMETCESCMARIEPIKNSLLTEIEDFVNNNKGIKGVDQKLKSMKKFQMYDMEGGEQ